MGLASTSRGGIAADRPTPFDAYWPNLTQDVLYEKVDMSGIVGLAELSPDRQADIALCVIDVEQAAAYLAQAALSIRSSAITDCTASPADCSATISGAMLAFGWTASYLSEAASVCGLSINPGALCATDATCLAANLADISSAGSTFGAGGCMIKGDVVEFDDVNKPADRPPQLVACTFDSSQAVSYLGRAGLQIRDGAGNCAAGDHKSCSVDIMNIISSFGWAAQFFALVAADCPLASSSSAACGAAIADMTSAISSIGACAGDITDACSKASLASS